MVSKLPPRLLPHIEWAFGILKKWLQRRLYGVGVPDSATMQALVRQGMAACISAEGARGSFRNCGIDTPEPLSFAQMARLLHSHRARQQMLSTTVLAVAAAAASRAARRR